jgi:hypothetical protein
MSNGELTYLEELQLRHKELDQKIKEGYSNYLDDAGLHKLKQEKLYLKDKIEQLRQQDTA